MKKNTLCCIGILFFLLSSQTSASPALIFEEDKWEYPLGLHFDFIEDKEKNGI